MKLIINIPAYNEEHAIGTTIKNIPRTFDGIDDVLIQVIDDGSSDKTSEVARAAGADIIVRHHSNRRLGVSFNSAVVSALENNADYLVNIDADGQFDSTQIKDLLTPILNSDADIVIGDRFRDGSAEGIPFIKKFLNKFAAKIVSIFLNVKIDDLTCGFRAHNREAILRLNSVTGFTYTQETIIDAIGKNLKLKWVPVNVQYFENRQSRIVKSVWKFVSNSAKIIIKAVRDVRPMKFFGIPGLFVIGLSVIIFCVFLFLYLPEFQITPYRNYLLISVVLFFVGMQFLVFALIADMIKSNRQLTEEIMYRMRKQKYNIK